MKQYALMLKKTKTILTLHKESNEDAEFAGTHTCTLSTDSEDPKWLVDDPKICEYIRQYPNTPWYNTSDTSPSHPYAAEELEVVAVEITIQIENLSDTETKIPTYEEHMLRRIEKHQKSPHDQSMLKRKLDEYYADQKVMDPKLLKKKYAVSYYDLIHL